VDFNYGKQELSEKKSKSIEDIERIFNEALELARKKAQNSTKINS